MDVVSRWLGDSSGEWPGELLRSLPAATLGKLLEPGEVRHFPAGAICFRWTDATPCGGLVLDGLLRVELRAADGRKVTIFRAGPGALVGIVTALVGAAPVTIQAATDADVLELEVDHIRSVARSDPAFGWALAQEVSRRLLDNVDALAEASFGTPRARLARLLLDLGRPGETPGTLVVPMTQQALADSIGTVREVVARNLAHFREEGVLETSRQAITITRPTELAASVRQWMARR